MSKNRKKKVKLLAVSTMLATTAFIAANPASADAAVNAEQLVKEAQSVANQLRPHYNLSSPQSLVISSSFTNTYNEAKVAIEKAQKAIAKLSGDKRQSLQAQLSTAEEHRIRAARVIDAAKVGNEVNQARLALKAFTDKQILNEQSVAAYHHLSSEIKRAERTMSKIYGSENRAVANQTFITPAKIEREVVTFEVSRYSLQEKVNELIKANNFEVAEQELAKLGRLERRSIQIKETGNKLHPGKYPSLPLINAALLESKAQLAEQVVLTITADSKNAQAPTVYGKANESTVITRNVVLVVGEGEHLKLQNLDIKGTVTIKGKQGNGGTVSFENVKVAKGSVVQEVTNIKVKADAKTAMSEIVLGRKVEAKGLGLIALNTGGIVLESAAEGAFGKVVVSSTGSSGVTLNGAFGKVEVASKGANLTLGSNAVIKEVEVKAAATLKAEQGADVKQVSLSVATKGEKVTLSGDLSKATVVVNNTNAKIEIPAGTVINKVMKGEGVTGTIEIDNKGQVKESDVVAPSPTTPIYSSPIINPPIDSPPPAEQPSDPDPVDAAIGQVNAANVSNLISRLTALATLSTSLDALTIIEGNKGYYLDAIQTQAPTTVLDIQQIILDMNDLASAMGQVDEGTTVSVPNPILGTQVKTAITTTISYPETMPVKVPNDMKVDAIIEFSKDFPIGKKIFLKRNGAEVGEFVTDNARYQIWLSNFSDNFSMPLKNLANTTDEWTLEFEGLDVETYDASITFKAFEPGKIYPFVIGNATTKVIVTPEGYAEEDGVATVTNKEAFMYAVDRDEVTEIVLGSNISDGLTIDRLVNINFGEFNVNGDVNVNTTDVGEMEFNKAASFIGNSILGDLSVNAPNATIRNNINVAGTANIIDVGENSWYQNGNATKINLQDSNGGSFIFNGGLVEEIDIKPVDSSKPINLSGNIGSVPVTISTPNTKIDIRDDAIISNIVVKPEASGTEIETAAIERPVITTSANITVGGNATTTVAEGSNAQVVVRPGAPRANVLPGFLKDGEEITLDSSSTEVEIYYTVDGSDPTANSNKYTSAIVIDSNIGNNFMLKAVAFTKDDITQPSRISSFQFNVLPTLSELKVENGVLSGTSNRNVAALDVLLAGVKVGSVQISNGMFNLDLSNNQRFLNLNVGIHEFSFSWPNVITGKGASFAKFNYNVLAGNAAALLQKIEEAELLNKDGASETTKSNLQTAINKAKAIDINTKTQRELDAAVVELQLAIDAFHNAKALDIALLAAEGIIAKLTPVLGNNGFYVLSGGTEEDAIYKQFKTAIDELNLALRSNIKNTIEARTLALNEKFKELARYTLLNVFANAGSPENELYLKDFVTQSNISNVEKVVALLETGELKTQLESRLQLIYDHNLLLKPNRVTGLKITSVDTGSIDLSWEKTNRAGFYVIDIFDGAKDSVDLRNDYVGSVYVRDTDATSIKITNANIQFKQGISSLEEGKTYTFKIYAGTNIPESQPIWSSGPYDMVESTWAWTLPKVVGVDILNVSKERELRTHDQILVSFNVNLAPESKEAISDYILNNVQGVLCYWRPDGIAVIEIDNASVLKLGDTVVIPKDLVYGTNQVKPQSDIEVVIPTHYMPFPLFFPVAGATNSLEVWLPYDLHEDTLTMLRSWTTTRVQDFVANVSVIDHIGAVPKHNFVLETFIWNEESSKLTITFSDTYSLTSNDHVTLTWVEEKMKTAQGSRVFGGGVKVNVNKANLSLAIDEALQLLVSKEVGTQVGNVPKAAHDNFSGVIAQAQTVLDKVDATQQEIDHAVDVLVQATASFINAIIKESSNTTFTFNGISLNETYSTNDLLWINFYPSGDGDLSTINIEDLTVKVGDRTFTGVATNTLFDGQFNVGVHDVGNGNYTGTIKIKSDTPFDSGALITVTGKNKLQGSATANVREVNSTSVNLVTGSLGTAGDKKITGLVSGKKYIVTVGTARYAVQSDGSLSHTLQSQPLVGTEIIGLTNGQVYYVQEVISPSLDIVPNPDDFEVVYVENPPTTNGGNYWLKASRDLNFNREISLSVYYSHSPNIEDIPEDYMIVDNKLRLNGFITPIPNTGNIEVGSLFSSSPIPAEGLYVFYRFVEGTHYNNFVPMGTKFSPWVSDGVVGSGQSNQAPSLRYGIGLSDHSIPENWGQTTIPLDSIFRGENLTYNISALPVGILKARVENNILILESYYQNPSIVTGVVTIEVEASNQFGKIVDTFTFELYPSVRSLRASKVAGGTLLEWYASKSNSVTGYKIFRGTSTNFAEAVEIGIINENSATSFLDSNTTAGAEYYYFIRPLMGDKLETRGEVTSLKLSAKQELEHSLRRLSSFAESDKPGTFSLTHVQENIDTIERQITYAKEVGWTQEEIVLFEKFNNLAIAKEKITKVSTAPKYDDITIGSNTQGVLLTVNGLQEGDVVKVYGNYFAGELLGQGTVQSGSSSVVVNVAGDLESIHHLYVTVTNPGKYESRWVEWFNQSYKTDLSIIYSEMAKFEETYTVAVPLEDNFEIVISELLKGGASLNNNVEINFERVGSTLDSASNFVSGSAEYLYIDNQGKLFVRKPNSTATGDNQTEFVLLSFSKGSEKLYKVVSVNLSKGISQTINDVKTYERLITMRTPYMATFDDKDFKLSYTFDGIQFFDLENRGYKWLGDIRELAFYFEDANLINGAKVAIQYKDEQKIIVDYTPGREFVLGSINSFSAQPRESHIFLHWGQVLLADGYEVFKLVGKNEPDSLENWVKLWPSELPGISWNYLEVSEVFNVDSYFKFKVVPYKLIGGAKLYGQEKIVTLGNSLTPQESVETVNNNLTFDTIKRLNISADRVTSNLSLIESLGETNISWSSSNEAVVTNSGVVNRTNRDVSVVLTATITSKVDPSIVATKDFIIRVLNNEAIDWQFITLGINNYDYVESLKYSIDGFSLQEIPLNEKVELPIEIGSVIYFYVTPVTGMTLLDYQTSNFFGGMSIGYANERGRTSDEISLYFGNLTDNPTLNLNYVNSPSIEKTIITTTGGLDGTKSVNVSIAVYDAFNQPINGVKPGDISITLRDDMNNDVWLPLGNYTNSNNYNIYGVKVNNFDSNPNDNIVSFTISFTEENLIDPSNNKFKNVINGSQISFDASILRVVKAGIEAQIPAIE